MQVWPVTALEFSGNNAFNGFAIGSPSNAFSVSTDLVSTGVTLYFATAALIDLFTHAQVTQILELFFVCFLHGLPKQLLPSEVPILSSTGSRTSKDLLAHAWKYARDTSMCMIENVSLLFAAIDVNSLAHIRDLIRMGSPSNALSVSTHFVSMLCHGLLPTNFLKDSKVAQVFQF